MRVGCPPGTLFARARQSSPTTPGSRPTRSGRSATGSTPARPRETRLGPAPAAPIRRGMADPPGPTLVLEMPREVEIPAAGSMPYQLVEIDPKFTRDVWVRASQVRPGNSAVVHHVVVLVLPPGVEKIDEAGGDFLAAYALPGCRPASLADGVAEAASRPDRGSSFSSITLPGGRSRSTGAGLASSSPTRRRSTKN